MTNGYGMPPGQPAPKALQGYGAPQAAVQAGAVFPLSVALSSNARQMAKWLKFLGVMSMIGGALYCVSIVGIVAGWFPLLIGYWQVKASDDLLRFSQTGEVQGLESGFNKLRQYYTVMGIMAIVGLSMVALVMVVYLIMFLFMGMAVFGAAVGAAGS